MKLTIEKTVTEEIEIAVPCYRKYGGSYYYVAANCVIMVSNVSITKWENRVGWDLSFKNRISEAVAGSEITEQEFEEKYNEVIASFKINNPLTVAV